MSIKQTFLVPLVFLAGLSLWLVSCDENADFPVGEDWINIDTKVYFIDSLTVNTSTFKFDSIIVSNPTRLLVGSYTDPVFGKTKSKSYVQLSNYNFSISDDAVFDSIALVLNYDDYFYNDTLVNQSYNIYKVLEKLEPNNDDDYYYNTSEFDYEPTPLASKNFTPYPKLEDSLHIRLEDTFGKNMFEEIRDDEITNSEEFLYRYKGLMIEPESNNTAILGYTVESFLRIYYTITNETEDVSYEFDIPFNSENSFNNISSEVEGTYFESLTDQDVYMPSYSADNACYIQAGTGIATRIEIPYIEKINEITGTGTILNADLKISLKQNSSTDNLFTEDALNIYIYNKNGEILGNLTDSNGEIAYGLIETENPEYNIITYSIPVKYFLDLKLSVVNDDNLFLAIYSENYNNSLNRYIFDGENASDDLKVKLELTYTIYDN